MIPYSGSVWDIASPYSAISEVRVTLRTLYSGSSNFEPGKAALLFWKEANASLQSGEDDAFVSYAVRDGEACKETPASLHPVENMGSFISAVPCRRAFTLQSIRTTMWYMVTTNKGVSAVIRDAGVFACATFGQHGDTERRSTREPRAGGKTDRPIFQ